MNTLKIIVMAIIILFACNQITAQITIDGTITDADLSPISGALVKIIDQDDTTNYYTTNTDETGYFVISNITDINNRISTVPSEFIVLRNYPNPFNPSTIIYYELPKSENIEITIYDILGREVKTLFNGFHKTGNYTISWNGRNDWNSSVAAGVYFCRLKTEDNFKVHKLVLLDGGSTSALLRSAKVQKEKSQTFVNANSVFNFSVKVTGNDILDSDFTYLTCSGDTTLTLIAPKILQTATIGPEGGKLENEEFSLTVPAGAFEENVVLYLAIEPDSISFEEDALSKLFRIDGLPEFYLKDLALKIKLETQSSDSISFAVGGIDTTFIEGIEFVNYDYYNAVDSSGYAVSTIPSPFTNNAGLLKSPTNFKTQSGTYLEKSFFMALVSPVEATSKNGNFIFHFPKSKALFIPDIDNYLEDAVEVVKSLGFNKLPVSSNIFKSNWPIVVKFRQFLKNTPLNSKAVSSLLILGRYEVINNKTRLFEKWEICINSYSFMNTPLSDLRKTLGRGVFENFTKQNFLYGNFDSEIYWLINSLFFWSEELFPKNETHIPFFYDLNDTQLKQFMKTNVVPEIFNGIMRKSSYDKHQRNNHNIAVSALIKYLAKTNGDNIVLDIYNSLISQKSSVGGLIHALKDTENIWWPNFFKEFIQGNIYNVPSEEFLKNITETIEFNDGDTLKYTDETYNDLSAKLFKININSDEIKTKTLNFKIDSNGINIDYVKTLVFGLSNNNLTFLAGGTDFNVSYFQSYDGLLACVVNSGNEPPYTGTSNIDLDIRVSDDLAFRYCDINFAVIEMHDTLEGVWSPGWHTDGVFKDNVFTGTINKERQGGNVTGSIRVEVDDNQNIIYLDVMAYHNDPTGFSSQWGFTAKNIPPTENEPYLLVYSYSGNSVCNYVKSIYAKYIEVDGDETEIKNFKCDDESVLHIKFHNWD